MCGTPCALFWTNLQENFQQRLAFSCGVDSSVSHKISMCKSAVTSSDWADPVLFVVFPSFDRKWKAVKHNDRVAIVSQHAVRDPAFEKSHCGMPWNCTDRMVQVDCFTIARLRVVSGLEFKFCVYDFACNSERALEQFENLCQCQRECGIKITPGVLDSFTHFTHLFSWHNTFRIFVVPTVNIAFLCVPIPKRDFTLKCRCFFKFQNTGDEMDIRRVIVSQTFIAKSKLLYLSPPLAVLNQFFCCRHYWRWTLDDLPCNLLPNQWSRQKGIVLFCRVCLCYGNSGLEFQVSAISDASDTLVVMDTTESPRNWETSKKPKEAPRAHFHTWRQRSEKKSAKSEREISECNRKVNSQWHLCRMCFSMMCTLTKDERLRSCKKHEKWIQWTQEELCSAFVPSRSCLQLVPCEHF